MSYIELHSEIEQHPKFQELREILGLDTDCCLGRLSRFWIWCLKFAETGVLEKHSPERIDACFGAGFVSAMRQVGFIDQHRFRVHDWPDHAARYLYARYRTMKPLYLASIYLEYGRRGDAERVLASALKVPRPVVTKEQVEALLGAEKPLELDFNASIQPSRTVVRLQSDYSRTYSPSSSSSSSPSPTDCGGHKRGFKRPTLQEVEEYCRARGNGIAAQRFIDHYEANGWRVGKNPMRDWQAAVRTWEKNECDRKQERGTPQQREFIRSVLAEHYAKEPGPAMEQAIDNFFEAGAYIFTAAGEDAAKARRCVDAVVSRMAAWDKPCQLGTCAKWSDEYFANPEGFEIETKRIKSGNR